MKIDKYLLALACGDSYGSHFENDGLCGLTFDLKKLPNKPADKNITDDTIMASILLKHYKANKTIIKSKLFEEYKSWAKIDGWDDGIGIHTYAVLVNNQEEKDSQGNGTLMRVIPFAINLLNDGYKSNEIHKLMNDDAFLTHENKTISIMNRFILDLLVNGLKTLEDNIYKDFVSKFTLGDTAWIMHSLFIVIEALKKDLDFVQGFKYITSFGGDTDTNCAIFAAIKSYRSDISNEVNLDDFLDKDSLKYLELK